MPCPREIMKRLLTIPAMVALLTAFVLLPGAAPAQTQPKAQSAAAAGAATQGHHEGYYYPKITSRETYHAQTRPLQQMDRGQRLLFVSAVTKEQTETGYAPRYVMFAKGDDAERLILVGLDDMTLGTIYRARAVMAALSSLARLAPMLKDADLDDQLNFYDLARLMGFR